MVMRDAKSIWGVYNTLYAPKFLRVTQGGKSMRDVRDFLRVRHAPTRVLEFYWGVG